MGVSSRLLLNCCSVIMASVSDESSIRSSMLSLSSDPLNMKDISWYHFTISRHVAESLLISSGQDGSFLLRDSNNRSGEYTLSIRSKNSVKHFPLCWDGNHFVFGFAKFSNVYELIKHFQSNPVIGGDTGVLTILRYPYPRDVQEPTVYDTIRVHTEGAIVPEKTENPTFAIASKEGYLTKLGQHRKNWKNRWFVLYKNELAYYKTKEDKTPIRIINIKEVSEVSADSAMMKDNCFRVVTTSRTYFLIACTGQETEDWIKILKWKIGNNTNSD